jgi:hypothetical protein
MVRFTSKLQLIWRYWCKALGEKSSPCNKQSDVVALIRTVIFLSYLTTNCFIVANAIRHWNDKPPLIIEIHYEKN